MDKSVGLKDALKRFYPLLILIAGVELLIWVHWNTLADTADKWGSDPKYSHGYLVPLFAGVLLFLRRDESVPLVKSLLTFGGTLLGIGLLLCVLPFVLPDSVLALPILNTEWLEAAGVALSAAGGLLVIQQRIPFSEISAAERWIGFGIVIVSELLRTWSTATAHYWPDRFSFIPALCGIFVMVGGLRSMRWAGWPIFFLIFMLPLEQHLDKHLSANLQMGASTSSTYVLQTLGVRAAQQGAVLYVGKEGSPMNVAEACSGLRMLTIFGALSVAVVLLVELPVWQRVVILLSAIPIALAVNIIRIVGTGILFTIFPANQEKLRHFFHDGAGLVMMPLAMLLLFLEYKIMSNLFIDDDEGVLQPHGLAPAVPAAGAAAVPAMAMRSASATPVPAAKPLPASTVAAKPLPAKPLPPKPLPAARPLPPKPLPIGLVPGGAIPAKPLPPKSLPPKPLPSKQVPVNSAATKLPMKSVGVGEVPGKPIPAKPLPAKPTAAKPPAPQTARSGGNSTNDQ